MGQHERIFDTDCTSLDKSHTYFEKLRLVGLNKRGKKGVNMTDHNRAQIAAEIQKEAVKIFCSADLAKNWMIQKNLVLGSSPLSILRCEAGATEVRKLLSAIAYGGVA